VSYGIRCDLCGSDAHKVVDKRGGPGKIRRRRECLECGYRFSTIEAPTPGRLKINVRRIKRLRDDKGKTYQEIAAVVGVSMSTVRNVLKGDDYLP
jgi:transcriptional regulator NrdR family protein